LLLQLMFKVPSISTHAGSQTSTPLIHCRTLCCDPSRTIPLSVAPSSGWRYERVNWQCWRQQFSTMFL